jgi:hypothetical protein
MRLFSSLTIVLFCIAGMALAQDAAPTDADDAAAEKESVQLDGDTLVLAYEGEADGDSIKEYIPADENLESWTKLAAVREFEKLNDPKGFADEMVKQLEAKDPPARYELLENDKTGEVILDFIVWPADASFVEFNIFKYQKQDGGGLVSYQYALRAYGDEMEKFLTGMDADRRAKLIAEMVAHGVQPSE